MSSTNLKIVEQFMQQTAEATAQFLMQKGFNVKGISVNVIVDMDGGRQIVGGRVETPDAHLDWSSVYAQLSRTRG